MSASTTKSVSLKAINEEQNDHIIIALDDFKLCVDYHMENLKNRSKI